jgi:hypothetical protein
MNLRFIKNTVSKTSLGRYVRSIYHKSGIYKRRVEAVNRTAAEARKKQAEINKMIAETFFDNNLVVRSGPFKGMQYIGSSAGSQLFPKIIGSYEEVIQPWIQRAIDRQYRKIIDVGCAEGYYAVGFALRCPQSHIYAYDIDPEARDLCNELMALNKVRNLKIASECTKAELNTLCEPKTLLVCDIEGFEDILLDPIAIPNLQHVDMIIEAHDCFVPGITASLINRFFRTHFIEMTVDRKRNSSQYQQLLPGKGAIGAYLDEVRNPDMRFIYLTSYGATCNQ